jgi:hypothetical protein
MSATITLSLDDEKQSPILIETDRLIRYDPHANGSIVTYLGENGLVTGIVRQSRAEIETLVRHAVRPA